MAELPVTLPRDICNCVPRRTRMIHLMTTNRHKAGVALDSLLLYHSRPSYNTHNYTEACSFPHSSAKPPLHTFLSSLPGTATHPLHSPTHYNLLLPFYTSSTRSKCIRTPLCIPNSAPTCPPPLQIPMPTNSPQPSAHHCRSCLRLRSRSHSIP